MGRKTAFVYYNTSRYREYSVIADVHQARLEFRIHTNAVVAEACIPYIIVIDIGTYEGMVEIDICRRCRNTGIFCERPFPVLESKLTCSLGNERQYPLQWRSAREKLAVRQICCSCFSPGSSANYSIDDATNDEYKKAGIYELIVFCQPVRKINIKVFLN